VKENVEKAIEELREGLPGSAVTVKEDDDGGAFVLIESIDLGPSFEPRTSWISFHITWTCPEADVYPHFIDPSVKYVGTGETPNQHPDGNLPVSMSRAASVPGFEKTAIQISRQSNRRDPQTDWPLHKLLRVLESVRSR
jgi:hypothetical protein